MIAGSALRRRRPVLASLGSDGALLVDDRGAYHGSAAVALAGSQMPSPTDLDRDAVRTTELEVAREPAHHA
jgi:hypothetical protein